jgi:hypothetical protein
MNLLPYPLVAGIFVWGSIWEIGSALGKKRPLNAAERN